MVHKTYFNKMLPEYVVETLRVFKENKVKAYVVGGAVRDFIRGEIPKDFDIATEVHPEIVKLIFTERGISAFNTDKEANFGRCSIILQGEEIEITTFRTDGESADSRHPGSCAFDTDMVGDSFRRDFTCNAMYLDLEGNLYDFHDGYADAQEGVIKFVGQASSRINEDHLRILRLFRFCLRFDAFNCYNEYLLREHAWKLKYIAPERIKKEMEKIFAERKKNTMLHLFHTPILNVLFGDTTVENVKICNQKSKWHPENMLVDHINLVYNNLIDAGVTDKDLFWTAILHDLGKPECEAVKEDGGHSYHGHEFASVKIAEKFLKKFRFSREEREKILYLVKNHMRISQVQRMKNKKVARMLQDTYIDELMVFHSADDMINEISPNSEYLEKKKEEFGEYVFPLVKGKHLIERGMKPGEHFGGILKRCEDLQHEYGLTSVGDVLEMYFKGGK